MNVGFRDILVISTPQDMLRFEEMFGDGHQFGIHLTYAVRPSPEGLAVYYVDNPERVGTIKFDKDGRGVSIEEKPKVPKSNYCITGSYFLDNKAKLLQRTNLQKIYK